MAAPHAARYQAAVVDPAEKQVTAAFRQIEGVRFEFLMLESEQKDLAYGLVPRVQAAEILIEGVERPAVAHETVIAAAAAILVNPADLSLVVEHHIVRVERIWRIDCLDGPAGLAEETVPHAI